MAGIVYEWHGYKYDDTSSAAALAAQNHSCPFVPGPCTKAGAACAVQPAEEPIVVCPKRLYFDGHLFLREIARDTFGELGVHLGPDGLPTIVKGNLAKSTAKQNDQAQVGVFGQGWAGEIKLPETTSGGSRYSVDFTLVVIDPTGDLLAFVPVEVQSIDTTGDYKPSLQGLVDGRQIVKSNFHMNWENVNKRILPQLIVKGLMLQGERLCANGIFFVTPESVYERIMRRLGGTDRLRTIPRQPGSITFLRYKYGPLTQGHTQPMTRLQPITISTSDMSLAFISPQNLPPSGSYEHQIRKKI